MLNKLVRRRRVATVAQVRIRNDRTATSFDASILPAATIEPGDDVTFEIGDSAYERLWAGESVHDIGLENFNAVTGPVAVRGAEPGDALRVEVLDISIRRAWAVRMPGFGPLSTGIKRTEVRPVVVADGFAAISPRLRVPLDPMIGCIGVCPAGEPGSTLGPAYPWGGNMDLRELSKGATLFLPVQVPGALLCLGDLHAAMGTGEPTWVALESSGEAVVRVGVEKGLHLPCPRLRIGTDTIFVAALAGHGHLETAQEHAMLQAFEFLQASFGLDSFEAYAYCCARVSLRFGGPASPIVLAVVPDPDVSQSETLAATAPAT
jgi:amidase